MGHRVPNHKSKCRNLHGHRYKIVVAVEDKVIMTEGASDEGMVMDFADLKETMVQQLDEKFDHGFVLSRTDELAESFGKWQLDGMKIIFVDFIPTAENLAKYWYGLMKVALEERKIKISYMKVFETPTSTAFYNGND